MLNFKGITHVTENPNGHAPAITIRWLAVDVCMCVLPYVCNDSQRERSAAKSGGCARVD